MIVERKTYWKFYNSLDGLYLFDKETPNLVARLKLKEYFGNDPRRLRDSLSYIMSTYK